MEVTKTQATSVQQFSALNAFKSNKNVKKSEVEQTQDEVSNGIQSTSARSLLDRVDVNDIRECAKKVGEFNITDDDIKYGVMYGRSVIAEWLC